MYRNQTLHSADVAALEQLEAHRVQQNLKAMRLARAQADNRPTPWQVAAICRAATTDANVDAAFEIYEAAHPYWTPSERAEFNAMVSA